MEASQPGRILLIDDDPALNVQVTRRYRRVWFRPPRVHRLGSASFGLFWFCLFLPPVFLITSSAALITLYYAHFPRAWLAFHVLWIINAATYVFITCFTLMIDPQTTRRCWRQGVMFPGAVNLVFIVYSCFPGCSPRPSGRSTSTWAGASSSPTPGSASRWWRRTWPRCSSRGGSAGSSAAPGLRSRLRIAAVRLHLRVVRQGTAASRDDLGQDREDREGGGPGVSQPDLRTFRREIRDATRYERGLAVKALLALAAVAVIVVLRMLYFA